ncbi:hypothetical protein ACA910_007019 [Epithemia clementina (nom. ined.)]
MPLPQLLQQPAKAPPPASSSSDPWMVEGMESMLEFGSGRATSGGGGATTGGNDSLQSHSQSGTGNPNNPNLPPSDRRRYERNIREQQRSYRISQQIKQLRDVLEEHKIPFKPNKFSILVSVVEYIKQLQSRSIMLDSEHARLVETVRQTNELVQKQQQQQQQQASSSSGHHHHHHGHTNDNQGDETGDEGNATSIIRNEDHDNDPMAVGSSSLLFSSLNHSNNPGSSSSGGDGTMLVDLWVSPTATTSGSSSSSSSSSLPLLHQHKYDLVFRKCPVALGIASLDGRILACNAGLEALLGVQQQAVFQQSMFVFIRNHQDVFEAMADLLKRSSAVTEDVVVVVGQENGTCAIPPPPASTVPGGGSVPNVFLAAVAEAAVADNHKNQQSKDKTESNGWSLSNRHILYWCGTVVALTGQTLAFTISLTNTANGDPKYFALSASPAVPSHAATTTAADAMMTTAGAAAAAKDS